MSIIHSNEEGILQAAETIKGGGIVAFPTETVYGLGANALDASAVAKIYKVKGRPSNNPLIIHVSSIDQATELVSDWPEAAEKLAERFWPGPLTLILPKSKKVPSIVTGGVETVAIRMPSHPVALAFITAAGVPIAAPSANPSGHISATRAEHVQRTLGDQIPIILDAGPTEAGIESTVIDLTSDPAMILRPGPIGYDDLVAVVSVGDKGQRTKDKGQYKSPGLAAKHYAPRMPVRLLPNDQLLNDAMEAARAGKHVGCIIREGNPVPPNLGVTMLPRDPVGYAGVLYHALHAYEEEGIEMLFIEEPPHDHGWEAVWDRLRRASA